jgi:hypothetical protein
MKCSFRSAVLVGITLFSCFVARADCIQDCLDTYAYPCEDAADATAEACLDDASNEENYCMDDASESYDNCLAFVDYDNVTFETCYDQWPVSIVECKYAAGSRDRVYIAIT